MRLYCASHVNIAHMVRESIDCESCNLGPLAVICPLLERLNVAAIINRHLPADTRTEFDHGSVLSLLIAARLYNPVALVNVADWASDSGADILWEMPVEKITVDRLGKSLDGDLFNTSFHPVFAGFACG